MIKISCVEAPLKRPIRHAHHLFLCVGDEVNVHFHVWPQQRVVAFGELYIKRYNAVLNRG